jgi:hypothetical protein
MRILSGIILIFCLMMATQEVSGQFSPSKVCRIEEGRLIFTLDKRWTQAQRHEIARLYDLDSLVLVQALAEKPSITDSNGVWKTRKLDSRRIELSKDQETPSSQRAPGEMVFLLDDDLVKMEVASERESVPFGVNRLTLNTVVQLQNNRIRFYLPGYKNVKKIFLSGSFNGWSTMQTPMQSSDSGWTTTLTLEPGKYSYKYILDGRWTNDPYNKNLESDLNGGKNSIFFCYNHQFVLKDFPKAGKVFLSGSFNNWHKNELRMIRIKNRWVINMFLREGTHAYKFIVDGNWINDPDNKITRPDGKGNTNSFMSIGDTLYFSLSGFLKAKKVIVSGNFNGWNTEELSMNKVSGGWELPYVLRAGNYEYKFIVDGKWITDPANPDKTGSGDYANSLLAVKPNYSFRLEKFPDAHDVVVAGSFNGWNQSACRMVQRKNVWLFPIHLNPGKYTYKFIVDGKFILDPDNDLWEDNEYGTGNSVLWINP